MPIKHDPSQLPVVQPPYSERLPAVVPVRRAPWRLRLNRKQTLIGLSVIGTLTLGALVLRFEKEYPSRSPASDERVAMPATVGLTRAQLNDRIRSAILQTLSQKVVYADVLGEGPGAWDARDRFPKDQVNCILWIQEVLALAFAPSDPTPAMDALRYFGGVPAFGMRKHFNAHWVDVEPAPLRVLAPQSCGDWQTDRIKLDYSLFKRSHHYDCPMYQSDRQEISYSYLRPVDLMTCAPQLETGFYVLFGVASQKYEKQYGQKTGPMGLVHGILLEVTLSGEAHVYHASTSAGAIRKEELATYVRRMQRGLHSGYTLYEIDPSWSPPNQAVQTPESETIIACESKLSGPRPKNSVFQNPVRD